MKTTISIIFIIALFINAFQIIHAADKLKRPSRLEALLANFVVAIELSIALILASTI